MQNFQLDDLQINLNREGIKRYEKLSFPVRFGSFSEIITPEFIFQYNLNGEIKYIQGRSEQWPHPSEWLKRTIGHDWVYYYSGGYANIFDTIGEYYLPCFSYPSNSPWNFRPFALQAVKKALQAWQDMPLLLENLLRKAYSDDSLLEFWKLLHENGPANLKKKARQLHNLLGGPINVLPPDTRHVDYNCLPLFISDGCLYNCRFCWVKTKEKFSSRSRRNILNQIQGLKQLISRDLINYNAVFLGQNDALHSDMDLIEYAALQAFKQFDLENSILQDCFLFLFGSVDSLLQKSISDFSRLNSLPYKTFINIGLESADQVTLDELGKPLGSQKIHEVFFFIQELNKRYPNLEISCNFLMAEKFSPGHWEKLIHLIRDSLPGFQSKGTVYLSPLPEQNKNYILEKFKQIKMHSRLPTYMYLIQRL